MSPNATQALRELLLVIMAGSFFVALFIAAKWYGNGK